jgi:hypothetical protein
VGSGLSTAWNYTGGEVVHWTAEGVAAAWNWVYNNASAISTTAADPALYQVLVKLPALSLEVLQL